MSDKHNISKIKSDVPAFNASFLTIDNIRWWLYLISNYDVPHERRLMFLPCGGAYKTRNKIRKKLDEKGELIKYIDSRKFISNSLTHNFMKAIRDDPKNENVILSEPLVLIPYTEEQNPLRPDYNMPVSVLAVQEEFLFIGRVSQFLLKLKVFQPLRKQIFYFGGYHHYFILHYANIFSGSPFQIVFRIPERGLVDYAKESANFMEYIHNCEDKGIFPHQEPASLQEYLDQRYVSYSSKPFLLELLHATPTNTTLDGIKRLKIPVAQMDCYKKGFGDLYGLISPAT